MGFPRIILAAVAVAGLAWNADAGQASSRLSSLSDSLIKGYLAKSGGAKASLAVFRFNCDEKLERQRVGFAVSELMSHRFVADGNFTVVERGELAKLLAEQRLQASGAVDGDTAGRLGRLLGAKVLLLGNIQKVDDKYQVNARLVDAETAEVIVSGYGELEEDAFNEDARPYLSLAPEKQGLGIYFLYNTRSNSNNLPLQTFNDPNSGTISVDPKAFNLALIGGGLRYFPAPRVVVDVAYMGSGSSLSVAEANWGGTALRAQAIRALAGLKFKLGSKLAYYVSAGVASYSLDIDVRTTYLTPTAQFRLEFRPQSRVGVSLSGGYDFTNKSAQRNMHWTNPPGVLEYARLNKFYLEPTISVYF